MKQAAYFTWYIIAIFSIIKCLKAENVVTVQKFALITLAKTESTLLTHCIHLLKNIRVSEMSTIIDKELLLKNFPSNEILLSHTPYSNSYLDLLKLYNVKGFFFYRDPRDQLISYLLTLQENPAIYPHAKNISSHKLIQVLTSFITNHYKTFLPWRRADTFHTVTLEGLVNSLREIRKSNQLSEIQKIASHLGLSINYIKAREIAQQLFTKSQHTKIPIGIWKKYFTAEHKTIFKRAAGWLLIELGYEKDFNW